MILQGPVPISLTYFSLARFHFPSSCLFCTTQISSSKSSTSVFIQLCILPKFRVPIRIGEKRCLFQPYSLLPPWILCSCLQPLPSNITTTFTHKRDHLVKLVITTTFIHALSGCFLQFKSAYVLLRLKFFVSHIVQRKL